MKTYDELRRDAEGKCTVGHNPYGCEAWISGYCYAATEYEKELNRLRGLLQKAEDDIELAKDIMRHGG